LITPEHITRLLTRIKDDKIRQILSISERSKKYPMDCLTDGAFEILLNYILKLENDSGKEMGAGAARRQ